MGELEGGVTGALIESPGMHRWWGNLDEEGDEPDDRFLSQGMSELGSELFWTLAI